MTDAQSKAKRGASNPHATLTAERVRQARVLLVEHAKFPKLGSKAAIAALLGISRGTLRDIETGRRWAYAEAGWEGEVAE